LRVALLTVFWCRHAADAPVFQLDLLDYHESGVLRPAHHFEQQIADTLDERLFLLRRGGCGAR
jgi:hypothetical protein